MVAEYRDQAPIAAVLPSPIDMPLLTMGLDAWLEMVLFDAAEATRVVEKISPFFIRLVNDCFADGVSLVMLLCGAASPAVVTRQIAATFVRPVLAEILPHLDGPVVLHHAEGSLLEHLDLLAGLPGVVGFVMDESDDLNQARRVVGPDKVLFGGPAGRRLAECDAAQINERMSRDPGKPARGRQIRSLHDRTRYPLEYAAGKHPRPANSGRHREVEIRPMQWSPMFSS